MPQLIARLYSTKFCHLCKEAKEIVHQAGITAAIIDIEDGDNYFEEYSMRIPVLQRIDNNVELDWPFDTAAVLRFLA